MTERIESYADQGRASSASRIDVLPHTVTRRVVAGRFEFPVYTRCLPQLDGLRIRIGSDYWPEAAFRVFRSARNSTFICGEKFAIPERIVLRSRAASLRKSRPLHYSNQLRLCQHLPDPVIITFLDRMASLIDLPDAKFAALALIDTWVTHPRCWPGAPSITS